MRNVKYTLHLLVSCPPRHHLPATPASGSTHGQPAPRHRRHHRNLRDRSPATLAADAGAGRFLGDLVRAVQVAGPGAGEVGRRVRRRLRPGQGRCGQGTAGRRRVPDPLGADRVPAGRRPAGGCLPGRAAGRPAAPVPAAARDRTARGHPGRAGRTGTAGPARRSGAPAPRRAGCARPGRTQARPGPGPAQDRRGDRGRAASRCAAGQPGHR